MLGSNNYTTSPIITDVSGNNNEVVLPNQRTKNLANNNLNLSLNKPTTRNYTCEINVGSSNPSQYTSIQGQDGLETSMFTFKMNGGYARTTISEERLRQLVVLHLMPVSEGFANIFKGFHHVLEVSYLKNTNGVSFLFWPGWWLTSHICTRWLIKEKPLIKIQDKTETQSHLQYFLQGIQEATIKPLLFSSKESIESLSYKIGGIFCHISVLFFSCISWFILSYYIGYALLYEGILKQRKDEWTRILTCPFFLFVKGLFITSEFFAHISKSTLDFIDKKSEKTNKITR